MKITLVLPKPVQRPDMVNALQACAVALQESDELPTEGLPKTVDFVKGDGSSSVAVLTLEGTSAALSSLDMLFLVSMEDQEWRAHDLAVRIWQQEKVDVSDVMHLTLRRLVDSGWVEYFERGRANVRFYRVTKGGKLGLAALLKEQKGAVEL